MRVCVCQPVQNEDAGHLEGNRVGLSLFILSESTTPALLGVYLRNCFSPGQRRLRSHQGRIRMTRRWMNRTTR